MSAAIVKGWCPSAYRPMMSGDGLLVRVRPRLGRLSAEEARVLAGAAQEFGNGQIDMTSRANLQIRGVAEADHEAVLEVLLAKGLVHSDPAIEARRAIVATPDWQPGDVTDRLGAGIEDALSGMPAFPEKMGFALDLGKTPCLQGVSGDFRFETSASGTMILCANGAQCGREVTEDTAISALVEMVDWFVSTDGVASKRMKRHIAVSPLPEAWQAVPRQSGSALDAPVSVNGTYGVPFGALAGDSFLELLDLADPSHLRVTPWRTLILENARQVKVPGFQINPDPALSEVFACPGAPHCTSASVATRAQALALAERMSGSLHVSGCDKGCAHPKPADVTLVGRNGRFDLVRQGKAGDTPERTGLAEADLLELFP